MKTILLITAIAAASLYKLNAHSNSSMFRTLNFSGYYENAFQMANRKKKTILLNYNKLHLNMDAGIDKDLTFITNIIFTTYHGPTSISMLHCLPDIVITQSFTTTGQTSGEADPFFMLNFENKIPIRLIGMVSGIYSIGDNFKNST